MINLIYSIIPIAYAHEEGATVITTDNTLGPVLAIILVILAIIIAKHIKSKQNTKYEQN